MIYKYYSELTPIYKTITNTFILYTSWVLVHYFSSHLYVYFCVPSGFTGLFSSFILTPSMHCQALRWAIYNGGINISLIWVVLGSILVKFLCPIL